jgi:hypothetical protein
VSFSFLTERQKGKFNEIKRISNSRVSFLNTMPAPLYLHAIVVLFTLTHLGGLVRGTGVQGWFVEEYHQSDPTCNSSSLYYATVDAVGGCYAFNISNENGGSTSYRLDSSGNGNVDYWHCSDFNCSGIKQPTPKHHVTNLSPTCHVTTKLTKKISKLHKLWGTRTQHL